MLSGLLLNVAIYAVVRCKVLVEGSLHSTLPSRMLMGFGLVSVVLAAFFLWRQRDIKRLFAYSSIEHMGIITFAFGMGGPVANFAALLHMTVHSLTKSAIFFAVGHAAQKAGTQLMDDIRGLITLSPTVGWGLMLGTLAILGMPPFGVFASEFLILTTAMREQPWATPILLLRARRRIRRDFPPRAADGVWRDDRETPAASARVAAGVRAPGIGADARLLHSSVSRRLVSRSGATDRGAVRRHARLVRASCPTFRRARRCTDRGCAQCLGAIRHRRAVASGDAEHCRWRWTIAITLGQSRHEWREPRARRLRRRLGCARIDAAIG